MKKIVLLWKKYSFMVLGAYLIAGLFDLRIAVTAAVCMLAPVISGIFRGRYWCGNLCPRGNFYDRIVAKFAGKRKLPSFMRSYQFRFLIIGTVMFFFVQGMVKNWGNLAGIGFVFYRMIVVTTLVGLILSIFSGHRSWCSICPMGTLSSLAATLNRKRKTLHITDSCISCRLCEKHCVMDIVPHKYQGNIMEHPDCIHCGKCSGVCPKKCISYKNRKNKAEEAA